MIIKVLSVVFLLKRSLFAYRTMNPTRACSTELRSIIDQNDYVKNCETNKAKDTHSLSSLIRRNMSKSDCIKLGTGEENII